PSPPRGEGGQTSSCVDHIECVDFPEGNEAGAKARVASHGGRAFSRAFAWQAADPMFAGRGGANRSKERPRTRPRLRQWVEEFRGLLPQPRKPATVHGSICKGVAMKKFTLIACTLVALVLSTGGARASWGAITYSGYQPWWNIFAKRPKCM